ncbi:hypothetical protein LRHMDP2_2756 [Lacticaseibacillus rhamnosus LRHMDP2]|uniref:Uncharacterized protein n=1 Tax=Lacticaseibacillus rhamnosus LRHMDP3 TaxID=1203259 RepID=A0AB33XV87_LACRH|nr:hypothetical protein LRHMDP2_2756 [Lacticaseibacillus rhamnosus LRHMDP2]EKS51359.1 hypothetical protein LRHMDP3_1084 [Lacticaseibacillus rhamnosus LRHMDP3]
MTKARSSRPRPLMLRFLTGLVHALHYKTKAQTLCLSF